MKWSNAISWTAAALLVAACSDRTAPTQTSAPGVASSPTALAPRGPSHQSGVSGAGFTATDPSVDRMGGTDGGDPKLCFNGQDLQAGTNNCNLYGAKPYVWLNSGPATAGLESGDYFWVVVAPGGQPTVKDGSAKNLSDDTDNYDNRTFHWDKATGTVSYSGTHEFDQTSQKLRVGVKPPTGTTPNWFNGTDWFADTPNSGGVYILGICSLDGGYANVTPKSCKFDAFKIRNTSGTGGEDDELGAIISIESDAVNPVGVAHTFTITVTAFGGTQPYSYSITPAGGPAGSTSTCNNPDVQGVIASCAYTVNSSTATVITASASAVVTDALTGKAEVSTDGTTPNSGPAIKTYVDAKISVGQDATNKVGDPHTVTGHVDIADGTTDQSGVVWTNAPTGTTITFGIASGPGALTPNPATCTTADASGSCSVTLNSSDPGITKVNASTTVTVKGVPLSRTTNGVGGNSGPMTKTWVSARISVGSNGTNGIGENHPVTGFVEINNGLSGWVPAPTPTTIGYAIKSGPGTLGANTCNTVNAPGTTTATGKCTVTLNSLTAGTTIVDATSTVTVGGKTFSLTTATSDNSKSLTKLWVSGTLAWTKVTSTTNSPLAGATFKACRTSDWVSMPLPGSFVSRQTPDCITGIVDDGALDEDKTAGAFKLSGLKLGSWTVTETAAPTNWVLDPTPKSTPSGLLSTSSPTYAFTTAFVNSPVYQGATATGGGYSWGLTSGGTGNWFMYSPWSPTKFNGLALINNPFLIALDPSTVNTKPSTVNGVANTATVTAVPLIAGQQYIVGAITATGGSTRTITIAFDPSAHARFNVGLSNNVKIQPLTSCDPTKLTYIQPGQFSLKYTATNSSTSFVATGVPSTVSGKAVVCYGIHVDVERALAW